MTSSNKLETLVTLQKSLALVDALRKEIELMPEKIQAVEDDKAARKAALEKEREVHKEHQMKMKTAELDLGKAEEDLQKKQLQIHSIKTNKEYTAMEHEIAGLKTKIKTCEDTILTLMEEVEQETKHLKAREQEILGELKELDAQSAELCRQMEHKTTELAEAETVAESARQAVHPTLIGTFDRLYARNRGKAVVAVLGNTCSHCNVSVTPQTLAQLQDGWDIIRCEGCSCILYMDKVQEDQIPSP